MLATIIRAIHVCVPISTTYYVNFHTPIFTLRSRVTTHSFVYCRIWLFVHYIIKSFPHLEYEPHACFCFFSWTMHSPISSFNNENIQFNSELFKSAQLHPSANVACHVDLYRHLLVNLVFSTSIEMTSLRYPRFEHTSNISFLKRPDQSAASRFEQTIWHA